MCQERQAIRRRRSRGQTSSVSSRGLSGQEPPANRLRGRFVRRMLADESGQLLSQEDSSHVANGENNK